MAALTVLREKHRTAARMIVAGLPNSAVAAALGVKPDTVSSWAQTPAFKGMVDHYRLLAEDADREIALQRSDLASQVMREMSRRVEDAPQDIHTGELTNMLKVLAPKREEAGPQSNVNILLDSIAAGHARVAAAKGGKVVEVDIGGAAESGPQSTPALKVHNE